MLNFSLSFCSAFTSNSQNEITPIPARSYTLSSKCYSPFFFYYFPFDDFHNSFCFCCRLLFVTYDVRTTWIIFRLLPNNIQTLKMNIFHNFFLFFLLNAITVSLMCKCIQCDRRCMKDEQMNSTDLQSVFYVGNICWLNAFNHR